FRDGGRQRYQSFVWSTWWRCRRTTWLRFSPDLDSALVQSLTRWTRNAFAFVQERFPEARLTIAGDGSKRAELEKLAGELKLRNTEFVGRVPFERMCD